MLHCVQAASQAKHWKVPVAPWYCPAMQAVRHTVSVASFQKSTVPLLLQLVQLFNPLNVQVAQPGVQISQVLLTVDGVELTNPYWPEGQVATQVVPDRKYPLMQNVHLVAETTQRVHGAVQAKH